MTRRKADKLPLPQTTEEAIALIAEYGAIDRRIAEIGVEGVQISIYSHRPEDKSLVRTFGRCTRCSGWTIF